MTFLAGSDSEARASYQFSLRALDPGVGMVAAIACLTTQKSPYFLTRLRLRWADAEDRSVSSRVFGWATGHEETLSLPVTSAQDRCSI